MFVDIKVAFKVSLFSLHFSYIYAFPASPASPVYVALIDVIYCHRKYLSILTSPLNSGLLSASSVFFCAGSWDSGMSSSSCVSIWDCCMSSIASTSSKISMVVVCFLLSGQHQNVLKSIPGTTSPPR